jgi:glutathione peroxidase
MRDPSRRVVLAGVLMAGTAQAQPAANAFAFSFSALEGGELPLAQFRGRVLLVVNTASFCGFTPQYAALQRLQDRFEARGLTVIGVPSQDFRQESGDAAAIRQFCDSMFGITFPMAGLTRVTGHGMHPFFGWATRQAGPVRWNFHKYLVSRDGARVQGFATSVEPESPAMLRAIEAALGAPGA